MSTTSQTAPKTSSPPLTARLDPVAVWRALAPRAQEEIGSAAVALAVGMIGSDVAEEGCDSDASRPYDTVALESTMWLQAMVGVTVLRNDLDSLPPLPDLRVFGIQQCVGCGCTDNNGCDGGCRWVAEDLCSACAGGAS